jgi:mannose-6-phosphate isomerase-like protein (cupin superfamily)
MIEKRPWGEFEIILDSPETKVKRIIVNPGQILS